MASKHESGDVTAHEGEAQPQAFPRWKKVLLGVALLCVVAGFAIGQFGGGADSTQTGEFGAQNLTGGTGGISSLPLPGQTPAPGDGASVSSDGAAGTLSPLLFKGGLSFAVGFSIGYALRGFLKVSAILMGVVCLAIFGLSYAGYLDIDWNTIDGQWNSLIAKIRDEAQEFKTFIAGSLPSAGAAGMGLFVGFKR